MMVLLQQGFAVSKKAKFFEIIWTRAFLLGFLKYFRNILTYWTLYDCNFFQKAIPPCKFCSCIFVQLFWAHALFGNIQRIRLRVIAKTFKLRRPPSNALLLVKGYFELSYISVMCVWRCPITWFFIQRI